MCPDRQLLSVYHDGELPSPWREKLEAHVSECSTCQERLSVYNRVSQGLLAPQTQADEGALTGRLMVSNDRLEEAKSRVWKNLYRSINARTPAPSVQVWRRPLTIPVPAAVAAVLVVAFLAALIGGPLTVQKQTDQAIARIGSQVQGVVPVSDMSGVLKYLQSQDNSADIVIIRLPENNKFVPSGEPSIIRAADYTRSNAP
jgi:anti-sigma factor RsiW